MKSSKLLLSQTENLRTIIEDCDIQWQDNHEIRGRCPFCHGGRSGEKTFCLDPETGLSICHRMNCGWAGNAVSLISELQGISYEKARAVLNGAEDSSLESILQLIEYETETPFQKLSDTAWIKDACKPSKCPSDVSQWLDKRGYSFDQISQYCELWMPPEGLYKGRVIFRVESKNVLAYQLYDFTGKNPRKTINPEGEFLSRTLFAYNQGKPFHEDSKDFLLIHEGIFDTLRSLTREYNACCIFGTNISLHQIELIRAHQAKEIVVCLDGDTAVKDLSKDKAWPMAIKLQKSLNKTVSIMRLPFEDDPDSCQEFKFDDCFVNRLVLKDKDDWLFDSI